MQRFKYHFFVFFVTTSLWLSAGGQTVEVSLNRNSILIGEQISFGLKVKLPSVGYKANFSIPDSVVHFDIIRKDPLKAVKNESALEQIITFTSFDSGKWYFPSLPVLITDGKRKAWL